MPVDTAQRLMAARANKIDNSDKKDIHERDGEYLKKSYENAKGIADMLGWSIIKCADVEGNVREMSQIHEDILHIAKNAIMSGK